MKAVQQTLNAQLKPTFEVHVDGDFGPNTKKALMEFQRLNKLPVHGELDRATRTSLGLSSRNESQEKIARFRAMSAFCQALLCSAEFRYLD